MSRWIHAHVCLGPLTSPAGMLKDIQTFEFSVTVLEDDEFRTREGSNLSKSVEGGGSG